MDLQPEKREILRYLGYGDAAPDSRTEAEINLCCKTLQQAVKPRFCYRIFPIQKNPEGEGLLLDGVLLLRGRDLARHLEGCDQCAVMAATLGIEADNLIRIAQTEGMSRALILDACATALTEALCDRVQEIISRQEAHPEFFTTGRFSPGYGDLPITLQSDLCRLLDAQRKIGLTVTETSILLPRKSVTALLGLSPHPQKDAGGTCATCTLAETCRFRKEGIPCESHHTS